MLEADPYENTADWQSLRPGQIVGGYVLVRQIGRGGFGVVYEGRHERLQRRAAIKVLLPDASRDPEVVRRFFNEAQAVNIIGHPGIVTVFEYGQLPDQSVYIIMEHLDGETLGQRIERAPGGRLGPAGVRLVRHIASALEAAHARGIVHRDLKPDNVMIIADPDVPGGERTKALDFGIAKMAPSAPGDSTEEVHTTRGAMMGTPLYMAPEQCKSAAEVDDRADVYSLGAILYEVLAGEPPFRGRPVEVVGMHLFRPPRPLREIDPTLPPPLCALAEAMLAKAPTDRPSMRQVGERLDSFLAGIARPAPRPASRWPRLAGVSLLCAAAAGGAYGLLARRPPPASVAAPRGPAPPPAQIDQIDLLRARVQAVTTLKEGLRDRDPVVRARALSGLGQSGVRYHRPLIEPLLQDPDPRVTAAAARALGALGSLAAVPALRALWDEKRAPPPADVGLAVAEALAQLGDSGGERLLRRLLYAPDPQVQRQAAALLAERGDGKMRKLALTLAHALPPGDMDGRASLLGRLCRAGDREAQEALRALLPAAPTAEPHLYLAEDLIRGGDERPRALLERTARAEGPLRLLAARILAGLDDPSGLDLFCQRFADPRAGLSERTLSAEGLGACGQRSGAAVLARALPRDAAPVRLRLAAAAALLQLAAGDPALQEQEALAWVEAALLDEQPGVRRQALGPLGAAEPRLALPLLGRALHDPHPEVRQGAAEALGRTRVRAAVPVLGEALGDTVGAVRREAIESLGTVGRQLRRRGESVAELITAVAPRAQTGAPDERLASLATLYDLGDTSGRGEVRAWLRSGDAEIRRRAIEVLGADPAAREDLVAALRDPAPGVRLAAATRLAEHGAREGVPVLRAAVTAGGGAGLQAYRALRQLGEAVTGGPAEVLLRGGVTARVAAVAEAARLPPAEALPLLRQALRDPAPQVRRQLAKALADLSLEGEAAVLPLLRALLRDRDGEVRAQAGAALGRQGRPPGEERVGEALAAYLRGDHRRAVELARPLDSAVGQRIAGAAACAGRDAELARRTHEQVEDPAARRFIERACQRAGIPLSSAPTQDADDEVPAPEPRDPPVAGAPRGPAPEVPLSNAAIRLPKKAMRGTIELQER